MPSASPWTKRSFTALGTKMPLGIVTRLAQQSAPANYPATARPWQDLHSTHLVTIESTDAGLEFFKAIVTAGGLAANKYARGRQILGHE